MAAGYSNLDDLKPIYLQGLNERITPESIPLSDLSQLIGLRQNKLGELVRYPGETLISLGTFFSIRGLFSLGEYVIIQTGTSIIRAKLSEVFPEIPQTSPELFPDFYVPPGPTPPAINPEEMSYSLVEYTLTAGTSAGAFVGGIWTKVPVNAVVNDANVRVSVSGANIITITAGSYPIGIRVNGSVCVTGASSVGGTNGNMRSVLRLITGVTTILNGTNMRETTANDATNGRPVSVCEIKGRFTLAASTDYQLQMYNTQGGSFGLATVPTAGIGEREVYAQLEILVEE